MATYSTKLAEAFAQRTVQYFYQRAVSEVITNSDYEGEIKDKGSILNVLTFGKLSLHDFTGSDMTADTLSESNGQLKTDQQKSYYFQIPSLNVFKSYIKDPKSPLMEQVGMELKRVIDAYILGLYTKVQAGQRVGTDYVTGTVTVTNTTGAVVGSSTVFTAAMVGRPFQATGQTSWYRVATFTDTTHITIVDDLDDTTAAYTGGDVSGGTAYTIQAATAVQATSSTIYGQIVSLKTKLDKAQIPADGRFVVMPADICNLLLSSGTLTPAVQEAYDNVVQNGKMGRVAGFDVYSNEQVAGDSINGYHCLAGHRSAITFAMSYTETGIEDMIKNFGKAYKGLNIYGAKVVDERRKALAEGFFKL